MTRRTRSTRSTRRRRRKRSWGSEEKEEEDDEEEEEEDEDEDEDEKQREEELEEENREHAHEYRRFKHTHISTHVHLHMYESMLYTKHVAHVFVFARASHSSLCQLTRQVTHACEFYCLTQARHFGLVTRSCICDEIVRASAARHLFALFLPFCHSRLPAARCLFALFLPFRVPQ